MISGMLRAAGFFLFVPSVATVLVPTVGTSFVQQNLALLALAWVMVGIPAAVITLRSAFRHACPHCGSTDLAAAEPALRRGTPAGSHYHVVIE